MMSETFFPPFLGPHGCSLLPVKSVEKLPLCSDSGEHLGDAIVLTPWFVQAPIIHLLRFTFLYSSLLPHFFKFLLAWSLIFLGKITEAGYALLHEHCLFCATFSYLVQK